MKYMLLLYQDEKGSPNDAERKRCYADSAQYAQQLHAKGQFLAAAPLHPTSTATSIRLNDGKFLVTDGPFAETREQLGGYFVVEAKNLDEALAIAKGLPGAKWGTVEIRPVLEVAGVPEVSH